MPKVFLGLLAVVVIGGLAVGGQQLAKRGTKEAVENAIENQIEASTGTDAQVDIKNGNVAVTSSSGTSTASYGGNVSLPSDFPGDVPTPQGATLTTAYGGRESGKATYGLIYTLSGGVVTNAATTYQNQLQSAGFAIESTGTYAANGSSVSGFTATKGIWKVAVAVTSSSDATNLTLTVTEEAATNMGY